MNIPEGLSLDEPQGGQQVSPPPGFVLDSASSQVKPPEGFVLDSAQPEPQAQAQPQQSFLEKTGSNLFKGIIGAPAAVVGGIGKAIEAIRGGQPILPQNPDEYMRALQQDMVQAGKGMGEWTYKTPVNLVKNPREQISSDPLGTLAWLGMAGGGIAKGVKAIKGMPKGEPIAEPVKPTIEPVPEPAPTPPPGFVLTQEAAPRPTPQVPEPIQQTLLTPEAQAPSMPRGFDTRGMRKFSDVNKFRYAIQGQIEDGWVVEYGHQMGRNGWARIIEKRDPGQGQLLASKAESPILPKESTQLGLSDEASPALKFMPRNFSERPMMRWIDQQGGINVKSLEDVGLGKGDIQNIMESPQGRRIMKTGGGGQPIYKLAENAQQEGYIKEYDIPQFLDAINEELSGRPQPSAADAQDFWEQRSKRAEAEHYRQMAEDYAGTEPQKLDLKYSGLPIEQLASPGAREKFYQAVGNKYFSLENLGNRAAKIPGVKMLPGENPKLVSRAYLSVNADVESTLKYNTFSKNPDGTMSITGEGLKPILVDTAKTMDLVNIDGAFKKLQDYMVSKHIVEDLQRPKPGKAEGDIVTPEQVANAQAVIDKTTQDFGGNTKHIDALAQRYNGYQVRVLHQLVESGIWDEDTFKKVIAQNPNYVPMDRVISDLESGGAIFPSKKFGAVSAPFKKIFGSERQVHDIFGSMVKNTARVLDAAQRARVATAVARMDKYFPSELPDVEAPTAYEPKGGKFPYWDNGVKKWKSASPNIIEAMTGMDDRSSSWVSKLMGRMSSTLRRGATITPEFILKNPIRDQFDAMVQTNIGFKPFINIPKSIAEIIGKSDLYKEYEMSGAAHADVVSVNRNDLIKTYKELINKPSLLRKLNIFTGPYSLEELSGLMEKATRFSAYKAARAKGLSPLESGFESAESTVDFRVHGAKTGTASKWVAFLNAGIQSLGKTASTLYRDPLGATIKGIAGITVPSVVLYMLNKDDPDYQARSDWDKNLFWHIPGTRVRIPKPFVYGQIFGTLPERFLDFLYKKDPQTIVNFLGTFGESLSPYSGDLLTGLIPTGLKPLLENQLNKNFFRNRPIVPEYKVNLPPEFQYSPYTTETARAIGKQIGYAPAKIENLATGLLGGMGRYALQGGDLIKGLSEKAGILPKPTGPEKKKLVDISTLPLFHGFVSPPKYQLQTESMQIFYQARDKIAGWNQAFNGAIKSGDTSTAIRIRQEHPEMKMATVYNSLSKVISERRALMDKIATDPKMTDAEKRRRLDPIAQWIIDRTRAVNQKMEKQ